MTAYAPQYFLTVYAPRSVDATETTILAPAAGAPHSDPFRIATTAAVAGFKPYLVSAKGAGDTLDILNKQVSIGQYTIRVQDQRLTAGGGNAQRWFMAFFGDAVGRLQLLGLKCLLEESLDNGVTRSAIFTGRIDLTRLASKLLGELPITSLLDDFKAPIFVGRPHSSITYAAVPQIFPVGLSAAFGTLQAQPPLAGTIGTYKPGGVAAWPGSGKAVILTADAQKDPANVVTGALSQAAPSGFASFGLFFGRRYSTTARVRLTRADTLATGEFQLGHLDIRMRGSGGPLPFLPDSFSTASYVAQMEIAPVAATDPNFLALPPDGTAVTISIVLAADDPNDTAPLILGDASSFQIFKDILDGKFGYLSAAGGALWTIPYLASSADHDSGGRLGLNDLIADQTFPTNRFYITERAAVAKDWAQGALCKPNNWCYRTDGFGRIVPIDLRRPTTLTGLLVVADADVVEGEPFRWEQARSTALTQVDAYFYIDHPLTPDGREVVPGTNAGAPPARLAPERRHLIIADFGRTDLGQRGTTIDAIGFRTLPYEVTQGQARQDWLVAKLAAAIEELRTPFGSGAARTTLACRRTANTNDWQIGDWRLLQVSWIPDPGSNLRGGTRLVRCISRAPDGPLLRIGIEDAGPNVIAVAPTFGTPGTDATDAKRGITLPVTLNAAGEPVVIRYAITATSVGTRPADTDAGWTFATRITSSQTVTVTNLPPGMRIWLEARSEPATPQAPKLPSLWAAPATDHVDLAGLTAPNTLAATQISGRRTVLTWVNGEAALSIELRLATPSGGTTQRIRTLPPGTTAYELLGLDLSTSYTAEVLHVDGVGGRSAVASVSWSTTGTALTAPNAGGIAILVGAA